MAIPSTYRWVALGNLRIRPHKNAPHDAPTPALDETIELAKLRCEEKTHLRRHGVDQSRLMWFSDFVDLPAYYVFLAQVGDQNTTGVSFIDFETFRTRDITKRENEGGHFSAHIIIKKSQSQNGGHLILIERVPGIYLGSVREHFAWLSKDARLLKTYNINGKELQSRGIFEIDGYTSNTIRDALATGVLQDIEFVKTTSVHEDGLDEDPIIKEELWEAKWTIKEKVSEEQAESVFGKMRQFFRNFRNDDDDAHMFVRIKTAAGQIRRTEVPDDDSAVLEQAFVHNEIIRDFNEPLAQRHKEPRDDVIAKMLDIPARIEREG